MAGAIFWLEFQRAGRQRLMNYARWGYGAWLVLCLYFAHAAYYSEYLVFGADQVPAGATARFARELAESLVFQQTMIVLLIAPTFAAGAVTDEKVKETLEPLFLAHLGPGGIILGKLAARIAQLFLWSFAAWPVLALIGVPAGLTPVFFFCLAIVTFLILAGTCAVSLLASVWARTTRSAVIAVYLLIASIIPLVIYAHRAGPRWKPLAPLDPNYVLDVARDEPDYQLLGERILQAAQLWGVVAVICTVLAIWRLRPAYIKQRKRRQFVWLDFFRFRPVVSIRPVAWKEHYVGRWPLWPGWIVATAAGVLAVQAAHTMSITASDVLQDLVNVAGLFIGLLCIAAGVLASGSIVSERQRQTWDVLLSTPLHFSEILESKRAGIMARLWPFCLAGFIPAVVAETMKQTTTSVAGEFGLVAVWGIVMAGIGMWFMTSFGLYISARSINGWLSLLATLVLGILALLILAIASIPLSCATCGGLWIVFYGLRLALSFDTNYSNTMLTSLFCSIGMSFAMMWAAAVFLRWTNAHLERTERVPGHHVRFIDLDLPYKGLKEGAPQLANDE